MDLLFDKKCRYRIGEPVQVTENSEIYKGLDLELGRHVAVKKIRIPGNNKGELASNYNKAMSEVKVMVSISEMTTRIPLIFDYYYDDKTQELYIIMEWINGETLAKRMKGPVSPFEFLSWMEKIAKILDTMSKKNIKHKDIKPDNIMLTRDNDIYLIDFNISVSAPNMLEGTPYYKAPEMDFESNTVSREKADMFSMGVIMYEYFTGCLPRRSIEYECYYPESGKWDIFIDPIKKSPNISKEINMIIVRLMQYDPKRRFRTYDELARELRNEKRKYKDIRRRNKTNNRKQD